MTTGAGLVAAGGQQSELDIRPLLPLPVSCHETRGESSSNATARSSESRTSSNNVNDSSSSRHSHRWHLRTPTGGSINNSICIQPDLTRSSTATSSFALPVVTMMGESAFFNQDKELCRHREKRRKEISEDMQEDSSAYSAWRRDDPSGRLAKGTSPNDEQAGISTQSGWAGFLERNRIGMLASEAEKRRLKEEKTKAQKGQVFSNGFSIYTSSTASSTGYSASVRVLVSNNDQSVKEFRLRPPTRWKSANDGSSSGSGDVERIESGLPGLSRLQTVQFPTCINHCESNIRYLTTLFSSLLSLASFSPDGRHLVSVGDTPEVFVYSVEPISGELRQIATFTGEKRKFYGHTFVAHIYSF